jgi:hypothetical protein
MKLKRVTQKQLREGVEALELNADALRLAKLVPFRFDPRLTDDGTSDPVVAAIYLQALLPLPPRMLETISQSVPSIDIVGDEAIDEMSAEGTVVDPTGHRDAFFSPSDNRIVIQPPENIGLERASGILLHEVGHLLSAARSASEDEAFYEAWSEGERASDHPSCDDVDENYAEAFRAFYSGEPLPPMLDAAMRLFDARARSQRLLAFLKGTELE